MTTTTIQPAVEVQCARHPDRLTALRCQRCSAPVCTACMVQAPVGFQCPACVSEGAKRTRQPIRLGAQAATLTYTLIAVNVVVALASAAASPDWAEGNAGRVAVQGGLLGGGFDFDGRNVQVIGVDAGEWYRVVTAGFIHGGLIHLAFNMLALWQAGGIMEQVLGRVRFTLLYFVSLLGGSFMAMLLAPDRLAVGASGAVFGLMGALYIAQKRGLVPAHGYSVGPFILINLALTFAVPGISVGGHVGGLAAGAAVGVAMLEFDRRRLPQTLPMVAGATLGVTLFAGTIWAATFWPNPLFS